MPHPSSLMTSLSTLSSLAEARLVEEREHRARRRRHERIADLVAYRQRRRVEQSQRARRHEQRRERTRTRLDAAARRRGIEHGQAVRARILAEHDADMAVRRLGHELELARARGDDRSARARRWLGLLALGWLVTFAAWLSNAAPSASAARAALPTPSLVVMERGIEVADDGEDVVAESVEPAPVRTTSATARPNRATPVGPRRTPAPRVPAPRAVDDQPKPTTAACDDTSGDPCCAFGVIMC